MALPQNTPYNEIVVTSGSVSVADAASLWLPIPVSAGKIVRMGHNVTATAHTGTDGTYTLEIGGVAQTGSGHIETTSSAPGDHYEVVFAKPIPVTNTSRAEIVLGGEGDAGTANFYIVIRT
jgi:hypothetical protein